jgi:hypothetical protein
MPITDEKMVEYWQEREKWRLRAQKASKRQSEIDTKLIAEFERRGTKAIEHGGVRVTYVAAETVVFPEEKVRARFRRSSKLREVLARCTKEVLDTKALASEVQAGNIPAAVIAEVSEIKPSRPYVSGSRIQ